MSRIATWRGPQDDAVLQEAARVLAGGGVVACPTETFYALAVAAHHEGALQRLLRLKGRPAQKPLLVLVADEEMLTAVVKEIPPLAQDLLRRFWPGPLTLIFPAKEELPFALTSGSGTIGVRQPGLALTRRLVAIFGHPITGTSANLSGQEPCCTAGEVHEVFGSAVDLILQNGPCPGGLPSTIVDVTQVPPIILRAGALPVASLAPYLNASVIPPDSVGAIRK